MTQDQGRPDADDPVASRRTGPVTIYDVAELAGVSASTVSRALGKPGRISAATEERIRRAAEQLQFRVNPIARALHTGRTQTIALVVADITNPVVFGMVRGAEHTVTAQGYTLVIAESQESGETEAAAVERILPSVDGVILATSRLTTEQIRELGARKPMVVINREVEGVPSVLSDVDGGVSALIDHLATHGHRSLAYLSGPRTSWISARRWNVMIELAEARGIALVEIGPNAPTIEGGHAAFRRVLASRATAAIAFNDLVAIGIMQAAATAGVVVPQDLSVTGFDDIFGSELIVPALTTVRTELVEAGERAAESVLRQLDGAVESASVVAPLLPTELIVRGSTGPATPE